MKLDPDKTDCSGLESCLKKLIGFFNKVHPKPGRPWIGDPVKTLRSGKLEDFDLVEFVSQTYARDLAPREDNRPVWDYSRALLQLISEMDRLGMREPKLAKVRAVLEGWTAEAGL